jgi:hypothetical protein
MFGFDLRQAQLVVLKAGNAVETATVGREGVVGAMAGLGFHKSLVRAVNSEAQSPAYPRLNFAKSSPIARRLPIFASGITRRCSHKRALPLHAISRIQ